MGESSDPGFFRRLISLRLTSSLLLALPFVAALLAGPASWAAAQAARSQDPYMSLLMSQPKTDISSNVIAAAFFDPPVVRPGAEAVYRVGFNALEESISWPEKLNAPAELKARPGGHGQILHFNGATFVPRTMFNYHVRATRLGSFTVPEFTVMAYGRPVTVPAAQLEVAASAPAYVGPALGLVLELSETNLYAGQAVKARVVPGPSSAGQFQTLMQVQINGDGLLVDQGAARQRVGPVARGAGTVMAYTYDTVLTPLQIGTLSVFAQGFSPADPFGRPGFGFRASGGVPENLFQFTLLDSEPVELHVRPLPRQGELPGFTGGIGVFRLDPPRLAADPVRAGDTVQLAVTVHGEGNVGRLAPPPPPKVRDWQVFAAAHEPLPPASMPSMRQPPVPQSSATFVYTLVPLTKATQATPPIPFSYFDPVRGVYVDLTVPAVPVTVLPADKGADLALLARADQAPEESEKELGLNGLAPAPGLAAAALAPVQRRPWFPLVQVAPAAAFVGLWGWDRRRRFLERHPEILMRRRARRALRRQRRILRRAARAGDAPRFAEAAVAAIRAACAPHYLAHPQALVGADVLPLLKPNGANGAHSRPALPKEWPDRDAAVAFRQLVQRSLGNAEGPEEEKPWGEDRQGAFEAGAADVARRFFVVTDAARFGPAGADAKELLALQPSLERVLQQLERRL